MQGVEEYFTRLDWVVLFGYLGLTTFVGHAMRGKQATIKDFFLGGRSLPWPAVSGSIIATEISGVTFIGVPGMLFALHGDFTYLQWAIGSVIARILVAIFFVRVYYEEEIYSPYDYMGRRLGSAAKVVATILFKVGSILGQSVRVLVAAIPLKVVTGIQIEWCIVIIGLFAVGWTLMGGMRTVIWTDVMQFFLFSFGALLALGVLIGGIDGGFAAFWERSGELSRRDLWNLELQADLQFTLWVALIAVPFQNLTAFGVDQLNAQRMFCCRDARSAGKALIWSSVGQALTLLMLLVGAALVVNYDQKGFNPQETLVLFDGPGQTNEERLEGAEDALSKAERLRSKEALEWVGAPPAGVRVGQKYVTPGYLKDHDLKSPQTLLDAGLAQVNPEQVSAVPVIPGNTRDFLFPAWIVMALPAGLSGLVLAGVFAAAISSLDSILAALSQTSLSLFYHPERGGHSHRNPASLVWLSRLLVAIWGVTLTGFTLLLNVARENIPILPLAFGMTAYTFGPLLGMMLCALAGRGRVLGLAIGAALSFLLVLFLRTDVWVLLRHEGQYFAWLGNLPTYSLDAGRTTLTPRISYVWAWPVTTAIVFCFGRFWPQKDRK